MEWHEEFTANNQPDDKQIAAFIHNPLWDSINRTLQQNYIVKPQYSFSRCSQPGWNIKYRKGGKSLCTLYPMNGYFIALVVVGAKEMLEAELRLPTLSEYVRSVFNKTKTGQGAKWLMLEIRNNETVLDALELIALRVSPKIQMKVEE